ncbi:MAG TPA: hypothetical protein VH436_23925 [Vicinamibacterales bacterium]
MPISEARFLMAWSDNSRLVVVVADGEQSNADATALHTVRCEMLSTGTQLASTGRAEILAHAWIPPGSERV